MKKPDPMRLTIVAVCLILGVGVHAQPSHSEVTITSAGDRLTVRSEELKAGEYISLIELFEALGGKLTWDQLADAVEIRLHGHRWRFTINSPFVGVDSAAANLIYPVKFIDGDFMAPIATLAPILDSVHPRRVVYVADSKTLVIEREKFNIVDYTLQQRENGILLEIILRHPLQYEAFKSEGNWFNISIEEGRLSPVGFSKRFNRGLLREVKSHQFARSAQISFRFVYDLGEFVTMTESRPDRIQVLFKDSSYTPDYPLTETPAVTTRPEPIDLIVIDPGHGGRDPGAIGRRRRTKEKDIVLAIANYLREMIEDNPELEAIMTRDRDYFVPLEERAAIANNAGADLFISIHANSARRASARGCQTFFLARAKNDEARAAAQLENAALRYEEDDPATEDTSIVQFILLDMIQTEFQSESADLAEMVQKRFEKSLKIPSRGVDQAGFVVLNKAYMPSVLVESAFISNGDEENTLRKRSFQKKVARSIYESILAFKAKYDPAY